MELIIEFILELFIEGSIEIGASKKISKWIRYPLLFIVILFYVGLISLFIWFGLSIIKTNTIVGIIMWIIAIFLAIFTTFAFKKKYKERKESK